MRTSMTMAASHIGGLCTAGVLGKNNGCQHPKVESADSTLCARHLLIAGADVEAIGRPYLASIVRAEEGRR